MIGAESGNFFANSCTDVTDSFACTVIAFGVPKNSFKVCWCDPCDEPIAGDGSIWGNENTWFCWH